MIYWSLVFRSEEGMALPFIDLFFKVKLLILILTFLGDILLINSLFSNNDILRGSGKRGFYFFLLKLCGKPISLSLILLLWRSDLSSTTFLRLYGFKKWDLFSMVLSSWFVAISKCPVSPVVLNLAIYGKWGWVYPIWPLSPSLLLWSFLDVFGPRLTKPNSILNRSSGDLLLPIISLSLPFEPYESWEFSD